MSIKKEVGEIIDRLATIFDEEYLDNSDIKEEIGNLEIRLKELTGKTRTIEEMNPRDGVHGLIASSKYIC